MSGRETGLAVATKHTSVAVTSAAIPGTTPCSAVSPKVKELHQKLNTPSLSLQDPLDQFFNGVAAILTEAAKITPLGISASALSAAGFVPEIDYAKGAKAVADAAEKRVREIQAIAADPKIQAQFAGTAICPLLGIVAPDLAEKFGEHLIEFSKNAVKFGAQVGKEFVTQTVAIAEGIAGMVKQFGPELQKSLEDGTFWKKAGSFLLSIGESMIKPLLDTLGAAGEAFKGIIKGLGNFCTAISKGDFKGACESLVETGKNIAKYAYQMSGGLAIAAGKMLLEATGLMDVFEGAVSIVKGAVMVVKGIVTHDPKMAAAGAMQLAGGAIQFGMGLVQVGALVATGGASAIGAGLIKTAIKEGIKVALKEGMTLVAKEVSKEIVTKIGGKVTAELLEKVAKTSVKSAGEDLKKFVAKELKMSLKDIVDQGGDVLEKTVKKFETFVEENQKKNLKEELDKIVKEGKFKDAEGNKIKSFEGLIEDGLDKKLLEVADAKNIDAIRTILGKADLDEKQAKIFQSLARKVRDGESYTKAELEAFEGLKGSLTEELYKGLIGPEKEAAMKAAARKEARAFIEKEAAGADAAKLEKAAVEFEAAAERGVVKGSKTAIREAVEKAVESVKKKHRKEDDSSSSSKEDEEKKKEEFASAATYAVVQNGYAVSTTAAASIANSSSIGGVVNTGEFDPLKYLYKTWDDKSRGGLRDNAAWEKFIQGEKVPAAALKQPVPVMVTTQPGASGLVNKYAILTAVASVGQTVPVSETINKFAVAPNAVAKSVTTNQPVGVTTFADE